jgi:murein DD-endopeptidase MepM/ murein hydrolase activator NlpD
MRRLVIPALIALSLIPVPRASAAADRVWPVTGPILRGFDPPDSPYGSGHRGIDIGAWPGTPVLAPADGVVTFAGPVGGRLFITIDHGDGLESTYSWLDALVVRRGDAVARGSTIAASGWGHADSTVPHLHMGVRQDDVYLDPLSFLGPVSVGTFIRLAPLPP